MAPMFNEQLDFLPRMSWTEEETLKVPGSDTKLRRWGRVSKACEMLDDCDRETLYTLIRAGAVQAYKLKPWAKNSPWKVDLLSVWEHKQRQMQRRA